MDRRPAARGALASGPPDPSSFIARFAGDDRYVVDYLVEELLRHQPEEVRSFLLRSSVLDRLTGPLCDAVTSHDGGSVMLVALERDNLFVLPLDNHRQWFRYHHLFSDVLRARLLAEQPDLVPVLHERASRWYERQDLVQGAVTHALTGQDFERAVDLIERAVTAIRRNRQDTLLFGWLRALPDDAIRRSPVLSVFYGHLLMVAGDPQAFELRLDDAECLLAALPAGSTPLWADTDDLRTLPATIAVYRASLAQARGDLAGAAAHARRALELAAPADHRARGSAAAFLGMAAWAAGDLASAVETFTRAIASLHAAGDLVDELSSTVILADMYLVQGRPDTARRVCQRALQVALAHGLPLARATVDLRVG